MGQRPRHQAAAVRPRRAVQGLRPRPAETAVCVKRHLTAIRFAIIATGHKKRPTAVAAVSEPQARAAVLIPVGTAVIRPGVRVQAAVQTAATSLHIPATDTATLKICRLLLTTTIIWWAATLRISNSGNCAGSAGRKVFLRQAQKRLPFEFCRPRFWLDASGPER